MPSLIVARLRDRYRPSRIGIMPSVVSSSSFGCHSVESSWITGGVSGGASRVSVTAWAARPPAEQTKRLHAGARRPDGPGGRVGFGAVEVPPPVHQPPAA